MTSSQVRTGPTNPEALVWTPDQYRGESSVIDGYRHWLGTRGHHFGTYADLYEWSVGELEQFWASIVQYFGVDVSRGDWSTVLDGPRLPDFSWFPRATTNYAAQALRWTGDTPAIVSTGQTRARETLSRDQLRSEVARVRSGLLHLGVVAGDVVAGYLPNAHEAATAFLATASIGAIWTSCAPEMGVKAVVDRFGQVEPKVLFCTDGYQFGSRPIDRRAEAQQVASALPSLAAVVLVPYLEAGAEIRSGWIAWSDLGGEVAELEFASVPFGHPLFVAFSSGTTGRPKAIVHGHGGLLLEHMKWLGLHLDVREGDRFFWFSTTSWIMWNVTISALLLGATAVLFDGDPAYPSLAATWELAQRERVTCLGLGAGMIVGTRRAGIDLGQYDLGSVRVLGSTGSPLPAEEYIWLRSSHPGIMIASACGGTDVATAFLCGSPLVPVFAGEISATALGVDAIAADSGGRAVLDERGELLVLQPMPSMPLAFWGDDDRSQLLATYFSFGEGVWRQGDWAVHTSRGSWVVLGRSDATLNRGGVRLGTGEYYSLLEANADVQDSLIVYVDDPSGGKGHLVLFVQPAAGTSVTPEMSSAIRASIRTQLSPRHVPDLVLELSHIPKTHTGKKLELPVKRVLRGHDASVDLALDPETDDRVRRQLDRARELMADASMPAPK